MIDFVIGLFSGGGTLYVYLAAGLGAIAAILGYGVKSKRAGRKQAEWDAKEQDNEKANAMSDAWYDGRLRPTDASTDERGNRDGDTNLSDLGGNGPVEEPIE